jgi:hypothetical protein
MTVVAVTCPYCRSNRNIESTGNPNEYVCIHCQTRFQIVRPADGTVLTDVKLHHCPICGKSVQMNQSFRCTECNKVDFCANDVTAISRDGMTQRFVCRTCIIKNGWACSTCGDLASSTCVVCHRRACGRHKVEAFGIQGGRYDLTTTGYLTCQVCGGVLCRNCVDVDETIFSTKYICKKCRTKLRWSPMQF